MAVTGNNIILLQTPIAGYVEFIGTTDAAGTAKTVVVAGTNGADITNVSFVNNGATAHVMTIQVVSSSTTYVLNTTSLAANQGSNGTTAPLNMLATANWQGPTDANGNPILRLNASETLQAKYASNQATTEAIYGYAIGGNY
jgi:hypothetical protein